MQEDQVTKYDSDTIAHFRGMLQTQRVELMAKTQRKGDPISIEEQLGGIDDAGDRIQIMDRYHAEMVGCQQQLHDVEGALKKCEDGTYGICVDCRTPILLARLEIIPTASRCVSCQTKHRRPGVFGDRTVFGRNVRRATA